MELGLLKQLEKEQVGGLNNYNTSVSIIIHHKPKPYGINIKISK